MAITNLSQYFQSQGQALPSVQQRQGTATQAGIQNYTGTAGQNTQLLTFLQGQSAPTQGQQVGPTPVAPEQLQAPQQNTIDTLPTPEAPQPTPPPQNLAADLLSTQDDTLSDAQQAEQDLVERQLQLIGETGGKAAATTQALQGSGLQGFKETLQGLNSQILKANAEIQAGEVQIIAKKRDAETRNTLLPFARMEQRKLDGDYQISRALKVSEVGILNAQAQAAQGNIELARQTALDAVDAKYAPIEEELRIKSAQLEAIGPLLDRDDKKQAKENEIRLKARELEISEQKAEEKGIQQLMVEAAKNGASQDQLSAIGKASSMDEAILAAGSSLADVDTEVVTLENGAKILIDSKTGKTIRRFGGGAASQAASTPQGLADATNKVKDISGLLDHKGFRKAVGGGAFGSGRGSGRQNEERLDFVATVENIVSQLTLSTFIEAKAQGATFGAMSEGEWDILAAAATKLGKTQVKNKKGKVIGYALGEKEFEAELKRFADAAKEDYFIKTGVRYLSDDEKFFNAEAEPSQATTQYFNF